MKPYIPVSVKSPESKTSPTEWCIPQLLRNPAVRQLLPTMMHMIEIFASLPVSNAWPERGASTLKALKTRLRNRLSTTMLESLMHVCINSPEPNSQAACQVRSQAVARQEGEAEDSPEAAKGLSISTSSYTCECWGPTDFTDGNDKLSLIETAVDIAIQKINLASKEYDPESDSEIIG